jgi:hypothetical protein
MQGALNRGDQCWHLIRTAWKRNLCRSNINHVQYSFKQKQRLSRDLLRLQRKISASPAAGNSWTTTEQILVTFVDTFRFSEKRNRPHYVKTYVVFLGWMDEKPSFDSRQVQMLFIFSAASCPMRNGAPSLGLQRRSGESDNSAPTWRDA